MDNQEFWKIRAKEYNNLKWVQDNEYLDLILKAAQPNQTDRLLDLGCGTGKVFNHLKPYVSTVIGLDISPDMTLGQNVVQGELLQADEIFASNSFNLITARMVFHHLKDDSEVMRAFYMVAQLLKEGGRFVLAESIPPSSNPEVIEWWSNVRKYKEERLTFTADTLKYLMNIFFKDVKAIIYTIPKEKSSTKNWLSSSGLPMHIQGKIYDMHLNAPDSVKAAHQMNIIEDDILCEHHHVIVTGDKK